MVSLSPDPLPLTPLPGTLLSASVYERCSGDCAPGRSSPAFAGAGYGREPVKPKGRNRKPQPASPSLFEWVLTADPYDTEGGHPLVSVPSVKQPL